MSIIDIRAYERLDSRGKPTVQVDLTTKHGTFRSIVPSGASKGAYEAIELRDNDKDRYQGNGVLEAVHNIQHVLKPAILKAQLDLRTQLAALDKLMIALDGSRDKQALGANAILGVSMAAARAGAAAAGLPLYKFLAREFGREQGRFILPVPFMNVLNGGDHSGNPMAFQEFMIAPVGAGSFADAVRLNAETYQALKSIIEEEHGRSAIGIGDEGGFAPPIQYPGDALDLLTKAIKRAGHEGRIVIGIDPASQSFERDGKYNLGFKMGSDHVLDGDELASLYNQLLSKYPVVLLEDPFSQDDWENWTKFNSTCDIELVGDDLLATNVKRIEMASEKKACNALLLKINQIGTITEALEA